MDLFILAGQSNMEGCGFLADALPPVKGAWQFDMKHRLRPAADPLHDLLGSIAPVDRALRLANTPQDWRDKGEKGYRDYWKKRNGDIGAGLGLAFARRYIREVKRPVLLVPCAHGGTSLEQWSPTRKGEGLGSLYGAMLVRTRLALAACPGARLRGLLWYQGESDANGEAAETYGDRFSAWVDAARRDLAAPGLPIFTVQLGPVAGLRQPGPWNTVRLHQLALEKRIKNVYATSAADLSLIDTIHIDAPGLIRLGDRLARMAVALEKGKGKSAMGPRVVGLVSRAGRRALPEWILKIKGNAGPLRPGHDTGFAVLGPDGMEHPTARVSDARVDGSGSRLVLRLSAPLRKGDRIAYNRALMPTGRLTDQGDQPLPAFEVVIPG